MTGVLGKIQMAGLSGIDKTITKATQDNDALPKPKHIRALIDHVEDEMVGAGSTYLGQTTDLFACISRRCSSSSWRVVLKSMIVVHQLMREAHTTFCTEISTRRRETTDGCINFFDQSSADSIIHSTFIRKYSKYLSVKIKVFVEIGFNVERKMDPKGGKDLFASFPTKKMMHILPEMMKQLETMTDCMPHLGSGFQIHDLSQEAMLLIIKDALRLYPALQLGLFQMLASFQDLSLSQAQWTLRMYQRYFQVNESFRSWFERAVRMDVISASYVPNFNTLPESLANSLKEYIRDCEAKKFSKTTEKDDGLPEMRNIEEILDEKQLAEAEREGKFDDLLGFDDLGGSSRAQPSSSTMASQRPDAFASAPSDLFSDASDWLSSLAIGAPQPVNEAALNWSTQPVRMPGMMDTTPTPDPPQSGSAFALQSSADDWFAQQAAPASSSMASSTTVPPPISTSTSVVDISQSAVEFFNSQPASPVMTSTSGPSSYGPFVGAGAPVGGVPSYVPAQPQPQPQGGFGPQDPFGFAQPSPAQSNPFMNDFGPFTSSTKPTQQQSLSGRAARKLEPRSSQPSEGLFGDLVNF